MLEYRKLQLADLTTAHTLIKRVFGKFEAPEYAQKGVDTFYSFIKTKVLEKNYKSEHLVYWGCFDADVLIGILAMKQVKHICMLFVDEAYHKRGIGRALVSLGIVVAKKQGYTQITVNSSPFAIDFYQKLGFSRDALERTENGIRFTPMSIDVTNFT